jgi:hypothetical protein
MTDRPIIFSAPMIKALLDGRKAQTRRVIKTPLGFTEFQGFVGVGETRAVFDCSPPVCAPVQIRIPFAIGDRLYVREAWRAMDRQDEFSGGQIAEQCLEVGYKRAWSPIQYEADGARYNWIVDPLGFGTKPGRYRHARFMPRWASRLTLIVTDVRVQRLQAITGRDIIAEGIRCGGCHDVGTGDFSACRNGGCFEQRNDFMHLWNSLHGPDAWDANPWVVAVSFEVEHGNIDQVT